MREINEDGLRLCEMQAEIFAGTKEAVKCSSAVFIRRFMLSEFAKRMDNESFLYENATPRDAYRAIEKEFGKSTYGKERYTHAELYWMGYIYRYWCFVWQLESKKVYKTILPPALRKLYFPYHSLDPKSAIDRILESKGLPPDEDMVAKGVEILRKLRRD